MTKFQNIVVLLIFAGICQSIKGGRGGSGTPFARASSSFSSRALSNDTLVIDKSRGGFGVPSEEDACPLRCLGNATMPREVSQFVETAIENVFRSKSTTNLAVVFDSANMQKLCRLSDQYKICVNRECSSRGNIKALQALVYEAACNDTSICLCQWFVNGVGESNCPHFKFLQKIDCYRNVYSSNIDDCDHRRKCLGYKNSSTAPVQQFEAWSDGNKQGDPQKMAQDLMRFKCYYFKCDVDCRANTINNECGSNAVDLLLKFYHRITVAAKTAVKLGFSMETKQEFLSYDDTCDELLLNA